MKGLYAYNSDSKALHIYKFCNLQNKNDCIWFKSEDEAIKYAGRRVYFCAVCQAKRDEILRKYVKELEEKE